MRLFSLFFAMLMFFSACQPQNVITDGPTGLISSQENTVIGVGVYGNTATQESTWLSEWDAQGK
ncbi:MAG: hypothetical protein P8X79_07350 [Reinekea sp.]|jgi:hypothetical protein